MASADFDSPSARHLAMTALASTFPKQRSRSPRVRRVTFAPYTRRIYVPSVRVTLGFGSLSLLAHLGTPRMRFVFLRSELRLPLLSDIASRRRRCGSARGSRHWGPQRTCTSWSLPGSLSLTGSTNRAMPGTPQKKRRFRAALSLSLAPAFRVGACSRTLASPYIDSRGRIAPVKPL